MRLEFNFVECDAEYVANDGLTGKETIMCLFEVVCVRIVVYVVSNLIDTWQRVKNLHVGTSVLEHVGTECIHPLRVHTP